MLYHEGCYTRLLKIIYRSVIVTNCINCTPAARQNMKSETRSSIIRVVDRYIQKTIRTNSIIYR